MSASGTPRRIERVGEVAALCDTVLVDQFGVLHDGHTPYEGAREALIALRGDGRRVVLVSNSGKRAAANTDRLERLGFGPGCFDLVMTSGEVAHALIRSGHIALPASHDARPRCLVIDRGGGREALAGLGLAFTERAEEADLVVIAGSRADEVPLDETMAALAPAARRGVPALCTNPDRHMLTPVGIRPGAGAIAALYERAGGSATWIGKPHAAIYEAIDRALGGIDWSRTLGIGDSAEHDIAGVQAMGGMGLLVETGVAGAADTAGAADGRDAGGAGGADGSPHVPSLERPRYVMAALRA